MLIDVDALLGGEQVDTTLRRRGPMRPERLLSVRQRQHRRLAGHRFRAVDTAFVLAVVVAFLSHAPEGDIVDAHLSDVVPIVAGAATVWRLMRSFGLYGFGRSERLDAHMARAVAAAALGGATTMSLGAMLPDGTVGSDALLLWFTVCALGLVVLHLAWWWIVDRWHTQGWLTPNLVVVGATAHAEDLIANALDRRDMNIIGVFDDRTERSPLSVLDVPVLGDTEALMHHRVMPFVDLVVVAIDPTATTRVREITGRLSSLPNPVTLMFDDPIAIRRARAIDQLADAPLAPLHPEQDVHRRAFAKRAQDVVLGGLALACLAPVLAAIALAVKLDSPGPVFFRQRRHGFNNEEIVVWKFRTMRHEAADARAERQVTAGDDRVTRVGRFLRSTSLDEVPQLINVLGGSMSLVGPRPHAIGMKTGDVESAQLVAEYAHRHRIKPGMTGWAAIHGSRGPLHEAEDVMRRIALDVEYIERQSFWLDVQIMVRTLPSMLGDRSAIR